MLFALLCELVGQKIPDGFYNSLRLYVMFLVERYLRLAAAFRLFIASAMLSVITSA